MELRQYQIDAVNAVEEEWRKGFKRTLLVLPTGCGKTICFSEIIKRSNNHNKKSLVLAHRWELLDQAADKIKKTTGLDSAIEKAESHGAGSGLPVTVGSIQTLCRDSRLAEFDPDEFGTIVVDEAHHALSESYQKVLSHFNANVLGVTATPDRGDMKNLGEYFESLAYEYSLPKAIKEGFLCPIKAQTIPLNIDLTGVKIQSGDFAVNDLSHALDPYLEQIADVIAGQYADRKTVVFLPLIETSKRLYELLKERDMQAWEVNGNSHDREEVLQEFESAENGVICNSMLLTEGWDCPSVDCVCVLRPTKIRSLYAQMIGRGTRLCEGKDHLLILDFLWHTSRHELCRPTCLICKKKEVAEAIEKMLDDSGDIVDISEETIDKVESDIREQREAALAKMLSDQKKKKARLIDPLRFEMSLMDKDLDEYEPTFKWEMEDPTEKQLKAIERFGIDTGSIKTKGHASMLLDRLIKRVSMEMSTPRQIKCLEDKGFHDVANWSFSDANKMMGLLAKNGWRMPYHIHAESYVPKSLGR